MAVTFTQYLMPDGRTRQQYIELAPEVEAKAAQIVEAGYVFEMEMLGDYITCSFSITDPKRGVELVDKQCTNGPIVIDTISQMIMEFQL